MRSAGPFSTLLRISLPFLVRRKRGNGVRLLPSSRQQGERQSGRSYRMAAPVRSSAVRAHKQHRAFRATNQVGSERNSVCRSGAKRRHRGRLDDRGRGRRAGQAPLRCRADIGSGDAWRIFRWEATDADVYHRRRRLYFQLHGPAARSLHTGDLCGARIAARARPNSSASDGAAPERAVRQALSGRIIVTAILRVFRQVRDQPRRGAAGSRLLDR
jgi:hypothetical protein